MSKQELQAKLKDLETAIASYKGMRIPKFARAYYSRLVENRSIIKRELSIIQQQ